MVVGAIWLPIFGFLLGFYAGLPINKINDCRAENPGYDCSIEIRWVPSQPWSADLAKAGK